MSQNWGFFFFEKMKREGGIPHNDVVVVGSEFRPGSSADGVVPHLATRRIPFDWVFLILQ